jgi:hypothetical protein
MKIRRRTIDIRIKIAVLIGLIALVGFSVYATYDAYQLPTFVERKVTACSYHHEGNFNYIVYLKNNSIYEIPTLGPGGNGKYFKKITDHVDAFFSYEFTSTRNAEISGEYDVIASVNTEIWDKDFVIAPKTSFGSSSTSASADFNTSFPINFTRFEDFIEKVEEETGVRVKNPVLIMKCNVHTRANTDAGTIDESFVPSLTVALGENTIEINGDLSQRKSGGIEKTEKVFQPGVIEKRKHSLIMTLAVFFVFIAFAVLTKGEKRMLSETEKGAKEVKEVMKKYGDWIVNTEDLPSGAGMEDQSIIHLSSFEDLIKVAEELGKPVLHKLPSNAEEKHAYYVFDGSIRYEFLLGLSREIGNDKK